MQDAVRTPEDCTVGQLSHGEHAMEDTREDTAPATQVIGNPTPERIRHAIAHSARIHRMLEDRPDHPSKAQFEELLENYKTFLSRVDPELVAALRSDIEGIHDMNDSLVAKTFAHLET